MDVILLRKRDAADRTLVDRGAAHGYHDLVPRRAASGWSRDDGA